MQKRTLLKTAAAHFHTVRLAQAHDLIPVTDSATHHALFSRTLAREGLRLANDYVAVSPETHTPPPTATSHG